MLQSFGLVPQAYAACTPGEDGFRLSDCVFLGKNSATVESVYSNPAVLVNTIVANLFIVGGLILLFMFIYAGFKFIQGDKNVDEAKTILGVAFKGFFLMFVAYWVVVIFQTLLGFDIFSPDSGIGS